MSAVFGDDVSKVIVLLCPVETLDQVVEVVAVQVHQYQVGMSSQMVVPMTFQADSGLDD